MPSDFGIEERLHSRCGAVVAERGCQRGQGFNASADVGIDRKEGEGIVAAGCHFLRHTPFGGNLHAAVQRVETGHVGLCADNVHQGQGGGERLHPAEPFGIAGHIVKDGHIPVLHLLAFGGGGPEGRGKHLHRIVGVAFDSLFQRSEVGMGGCGHNGHFAPTVQHLDNHRAAVVGRGGLAGRGRQGDSVALQPCAVGIEGDVERLAKTIFGKRHGLGDYRPAFVRHRQGGAFALQKVGAYGHLHGELAARIGYPVAPHFRHPGIAPAGGVAQSDGVYRHPEGCCGSFGICSAVDNAVAHQHHGTHIAPCIAVAHRLQRGGNIGAAASERVVHHFVLLLHLLDARGDGLLLDGDRLAHVAHHHHHGPLVAAHFAFQHRPHQQQGEDGNRRKPQHRQGYGSPAVAVGLLVVQPV